MAVSVRECYNEGVSGRCPHRLRTVEPFKFVNPGEHPLCTFKEEGDDITFLTYHFESEGDDDSCWESGLDEMMATFDAAGIPYTLTAIIPLEEDEYDYDYRHNHPSLSAAERNPTLR